MSELTKELEAIAASLVPSKAEFTVGKAYGGRITLRKTGKVTSEHPSIFTTDLLRYANEGISEKELKHVIIDNGIHNTRYFLHSSIRDTIISILYNYLGTNNNRLTKPYRWYHMYLGNDRMNNCVRFENDMFAIYKHIRQIENFSAADGQQILTILELIRQRYETSEGWKL